MDDLESFLDQMPQDERSCLLLNVSGDSLWKLLDRRYSATLEEAETIERCISRGTLARIYMGEVEEYLLDPFELSADTASCLGEHFKKYESKYQLFFALEIINAQAMPTSSSDEEDREILQGSIIWSAFACFNRNEWLGAGRSYELDFDDLRLDALKCLHEEMGPEGFVEFLALGGGKQPALSLFTSTSNCGVDLNAVLTNRKEPTPTPIPTVRPAPTAAPQPAPTAAPQPAPTAAPQPASTAPPAQQPAPTAAPSVPKTRLQIVRERGILVCAGRSGLPGFVDLDALGNIVGFDIDLCRAVAAAVLGDPNAIAIMEIVAAERGPVLQHGEVDLLIGMVAWTSSRDAQWGDYPQTMFFDGQGFMVYKRLGLTSVLELQEAKVCVTQGTLTGVNLYEFSKQHNLNIEILDFDNIDESVVGYRRGLCDAVTDDLSRLAAIRTAFEDRDDHVILPEAISDAPMGPVVPHGDAQWLNIVRTVMAILIHGEAYGITQTSVPSASTGEIAVDRLLGIEGSFGQENLGLSRVVAQDVLRGVGNYGEIYDRNLGPDGINVPREGGRNALWADAPCRDCPRGGQIYAVPLR